MGRTIQPILTRYIDKLYLFAEIPPILFSIDISFFYSLKILLYLLKLLFHWCVYVLKYS